MPDRADFKPLVDAVIEQLKGATRQTESQLRPFAERHVPLIAKWESERRAAELAGDFAAAKWKERSRRQAIQAAVREAASLGVNVQAAGEGGIISAIKIALAML